MGWCGGGLRGGIVETTAGAAGGGREREVAVARTVYIGDSATDLAYLLKADAWGFVSGMG